MEIDQLGYVQFKGLVEAIDYEFVDLELLDLALRHSSLMGLTKQKETSNERLEFLGDKVLGLVVAELLLNHFPDENEGEVSMRHSALVRTETLAIIAKDLNLGDYIRMSKGEENAGGRANPTLLANTCEALIAAIFIDGGFDEVCKFVSKFWNPLIDNTLLPPKDAKTELQEWVQKKGLPVPQYSEVERKGPDHEPIFTILVEIDGYGPKKGIGPSKRIAEQKAAEKLLDSLPIKHER